MNKAIYYKYMFMVAGIGYILAVLAPTVDTFLQIFVIYKKPEIYIWLYSFLFLIINLGFMYFLVGLDITKNHLVVSAGILLKISLFMIYLIFFIMNLCGIPMLVVGAVDLVFAALFIEFFINFKKLDPTQIVLAYPIRTKE
ncbi:MAG: hypothetical protein HZR80_04745 [Candidatus Heimdallarchaeota archaeon]